MSKYKFLDYLYLHISNLQKINRIGEPSIDCHAIVWHVDIIKVCVLIRDTIYESLVKIQDFRQKNVIKSESLP